MKHFITIYMILTSCLLLSLSAAQAGPPPTDWQSFSENLMRALKSEHPGLQNSALQQIIQYADSLDLDDAVYDIALIFRFDDNPRAQRMAAVALYKIHTRESVAYLCQNMKYVRNKSALRQCCAMVNEYCSSLSPKQQQEFIAAVSY